TTGTCAVRRCPTQGGRAQPHIPASAALVSGGKHNGSQRRKMFCIGSQKIVEVCDVCRAAKHRGKSRFTAKLFGRRRSRATQTRAHRSPTRSDHFGVFAKRNFAGASLDPPFRKT